MMYLIVISHEDVASVNIRDRLLELSGWEELKDLKFEGNKVNKFQDSAIMVNINQYHLYYDNIDQRVTDELTKHGLDFKPAAVIFPSKHRSESGMKTLTVHPIGNYNKAEYGGKPGELVPAAPYLMSMAYRKLYDNALELNLEHAVTFEVTHHGPYLETPSFFIEIGSDETAWVSEVSASAIAKTLVSILELNLKDRCKDFPVALGVGGGHYAPRHSDVARKKCVSIGHMIPNYALEGISNKMLSRALERTPDAKLIYFHKKALKKDQYRTLKSWFENEGFDVVSSSDLEDI